MLQFSLLTKYCEFLAKKCHLTLLKQLIDTKSMFVVS